MADLGAFARGLQSSFALGSNLRFAREDRRTMAVEREHLRKERERERGEIEQIGGAYREGGLSQASDTALGLGRVDAGSSLDQMQRLRENYKETKADKSQQDFGKHLSAGWQGDDENIAGNIDFLNRLVKTDPQMVRKAASLEDHRVPLNFVLQQGPDGEEHLTPEVFNKKTNTIGPVTEGASAKASDNVITMNPSRIMSIGRMWASGTTLKPKAEEWHSGEGVLYERGSGKIKELPGSGGAAGKGAGGGGAGSWGMSQDGTMLFNKKTAETKPVPKSPAGWRKEIYGHADMLGETKGAMSFDVQQRSRFVSTLSEVADAAQKAGFDPFQAMNRAGGYLTSPSELSESVLKKR